MPEPLDYESRIPRADKPAPRTFNPVPVPPPFDSRITTSDDHPGVRSVELALARAAIPFFRAEGDARIIGRPVTLWCARVDHPRALALAAEVFARRAKVKSTPPPKSDLTDHATSGDTWGLD